MANFIERNQQRKEKEVNNILMYFEQRIRHDFHMVYKNEMTDNENIIKIASIFNWKSYPSYNKALDDYNRIINQISNKSFFESVLKDAKNPFQFLNLAFLCIFVPIRFPNSSRHDFLEPV